MKWNHGFIACFKTLLAAKQRTEISETTLNNTVFKRFWFVGVISHIWRFQLRLKWNTRERLVTCTLVIQNKTKDFSPFLTILYLPGAYFQITNALMTFTVKHDPHVRLTSFCPLESLWNVNKRCDLITHIVNLV